MILRYFQFSGMKGELTKALPTDLKPGILLIILQYIIQLLKTRILHPKF